MSLFYIMKVRCLTEDPNAELVESIRENEEGETEITLDRALTVPQETMVIFQDRLPEPATNDAEVVDRFKVACQLGEPIRDGDQVFLYRAIVDSYILEVLLCWDKTCIDNKLHLFNC